MTPTHPSNTSASVGGPSSDAQDRVVWKRNRVALSCGPCRHRKLKCNRMHPCGNCIRIGDASLCSYTGPGTTKKNQSQEGTSPQDMQNRINYLEGLVLSLTSNGAQSAGPAAATISHSQSIGAGSSSFPLIVEPEDDDMIQEEEEDVEEDDSDVGRVASSLGELNVDVDKGKSLYLGGSHWNLVLADIAEVKGYFALHEKDLEKKYEKTKLSTPSTAIDGPALLFNSNSPPTDIEHRSEVPQQSMVGKLVTRYFNSYDASIYILHSPTFYKELQNHWQDPSKTSIVWLGLLYSILCLAMQSYHKIGDEPPEWKGRSLELAAEYRLRTVQCLANSDYTESSTYTIETLILYVQGEYGGRFDAEVGIWVIVGMIVRLSIRMGYHRDPSKYPMLTPYQGEMRRRVWAIVRQMDIMFSFQLALPAMIRSSDCDTAIPRNIFEDDFGPDSRVLPPARPVTEPTPVSYIITKTQILFEFGAILEKINSLNGKSVSYDEILKRDSQLQELGANIAPHLRLRPMEECTFVPATLMMQRFTLDIMWQKAVCVLHRKYIARSRQNSRYAHSRRACVEASIEILHHQARLHEESQPGGRMHAMKWLISSLTKADYLLGAMIVCLELHYDSVSESLAERPLNDDMYFWTLAQRSDMLQALDRCQQLWKESAETSMEAYKASHILGIMLDKLRCPTSKPIQGPTSSDDFAQLDTENLEPEHSATKNLGMLSGGLSPNTAAMLSSPVVQSPRGTSYTNFDVGMGDSSNTGVRDDFSMDTSNSFGSLNNMPSPFSVFGDMGSGTSMMDVPEAFEWEAWDAYIQNASAIDPAFQYNPTSIDKS